MKSFGINQNGSALLTMIIVMPFLILITALYMELTVSSLNIARGDRQRTHAQMATDAGIDVAMEEVNKDNAWPGTGTNPDGTGVEVELHNDTNVRTTYEVSVATIDANNKTVTSIGRSYSPAANTTPSATVKINADLRPVKSGEYSVVGGVGGLIMSNSAKIMGGDVFINGTVKLSNSAQIGLTTSPVNLNVAHKSCPNPPNLTYPVVCNNGENGQPITLNNLSRIYGTVRANNQTDGSKMSSPGLKTPYCLMPTVGPNCVTPENLPPHDRDAQKTAINAADAANSPDAISGATASCSSGTRSWPANLKITGDVTISNTCKVTINGNVWITGKLNVQNLGEMIVSNTLGATKPAIMIDGESAQFDQNSILRSNSSSTGFLIITYKSEAACSPDCPDVVGSDLFNSQNVPTIELDNSAAGPNTIFYARWSKVLVNNSGQIGALVGQTVEIANNGTITFGSSTGTGTLFWIIDGYRRQF